MASQGPGVELLPPGYAYTRALGEVRGFTSRMIRQAEVSVDLGSDKLHAAWVGRTILSAEPVLVTVGMGSSLFSGGSLITVSVVGEQTNVARRYQTGRNALLTDYGHTTASADVVVSQAVGNLGLAAFDHVQAREMLALQEVDAN
jgi:hypothetical protein